MALDADWDIVVVDEAHHLNWQESDHGELYQFVDNLSQLCSGLLLLTATPEQAGVESHFARLRLLDPNRFRDFEQFLEEQRHYGEWNAVIEALQAEEVPPQMPEGIDLTLEPQQQIRQLLDRYGTGRVLFRNTRSSVPGFPKRRLHPAPLPFPNCYSENRSHLYPEQAVEESVWLAEDPRVHWLEETLRSLRPAKVLVIAANANTALALEHHLHLRAGIRCAAFHEGLSLIERDRAAAFFADDMGGAQALICSEIGSEGRNFQFAHHLICFDLPENPDLLEQRIGRLDRIGQVHDVQIHVPYLEDSAQAVLFRWHHEGLAAFTTACAAGHSVYEQVLTALTLALEDPLGDIDPLIATSRERRENLEREMERGRDRLLELNSHDPILGQTVIDSVRHEEAPEQIEQYAELLFDRIGITQDLHSDTCYVLRPSEMMITGDLPGLDEDGTTVTFSRTTALARDDVQFLTWEHPLIREAMAIVSASELGNAAIGTLKHPKIRPGTVLLEAIYGIDCLAPANLELGRFLPMTPLRLVIGPDGRDVAATVSHDALNRMLEPIAPATSAGVIRQIKPLVERQLGKADQLAQSQLDELRSQALSIMAESLGEERDRLIYLSSVNPSVRPAEIEAIDSRIEASQRAIADARSAPQALRVVVAT